MLHLLVLDVESQLVPVKKKTKTNLYLKLNYLLLTAKVIVKSTAASAAEDYNIVGRMWMHLQEMTKLFLNLWNTWSCV